MGIVSICCPFLENPRSASLRTQTYCRLSLDSADHSLAQVAQNYCARYSLRGALEFHSIMESDWPKRNKSHYVTEIVSWLGFADVIFGGVKRQPEIRLVRRV